MYNRIFSRYFSNAKRLYPQEIPLQSLTQRGFLIENLPKEWVQTTEKILDTFSKCGIKLHGDEIHIMRNRFGIPYGRVMVLTERVARPNFDFEMDGNKLDNGTSANNPENDETITITNEIQQAIIDALPQEARTYVCDEHDVKCFVEQCERFLMQSCDLRKLADWKHFHSTVTITGMNKTYGRVELSQIIKNESGVDVEPHNIIYRFKSNGEQDSTAWVICKCERDANRILSKIQELEIPKRFQYGSLMGASFLYSFRNSLFLSHPDIDFQTYKSKYQIFTMGWQPDVDEKELMDLAVNLKFYPKSVKLIKIPCANDPGYEIGAFFECDRMKNTKKQIIRMAMLKKKWKIPTHSVLFAYPKTADVHWETDAGVYKDDDKANDSDLDEPIDY
ncbi:hypothetical protein BdWA1_001670 [Babesia duncani]|uniref:Uncharacterized protein n=1 Tax=Babesia duncani TaxID=323732 RepID=A0AAD9PKA9_9APIC|nr:hypothetical protein BdWA1_001670 [Babesia duncani]